jgi:Family of unknown function (DUF6088)
MVISYKQEKMRSISNKIMHKIQRDGAGYVFTPRDFIDFGTRQAIDTALSRLVVQGAIRRLSRGLYDYPKKHPLLGDLLPSLDDVASSIAKDSDSRIQISGARSAYLLGLTTQVPAQTVYLTDGTSKEIQIGNSILKLKHANSRLMAGAGSKVGTILQAIRYLGKNNFDNKVLNKIANQLTDYDKKALKALVRYVPAWVKPNIDQMLYDKGKK